MTQYTDSLHNVYLIFFKSFINTHDRTDNFYCWFFVVLFWCWSEQQEGIPNIRENKKHRFYSRHFLNKTLETLQLAKSYHHYWWLYFYWSWLETIDPRNKAGNLCSCNDFFCHYNIFIVTLHLLTNSPDIRQNLHVHNI